MNPLTDDFIAMDTNVFLHLQHKPGTKDSVNSDSHIDGLLDRLQADGIGLLYDSENKIGGEYLEYIQPMLDEDDTDTKRQRLQYWMNEAPIEKVTLERKSQLLQAIKNVIHENKEECDRVFVYVAFNTGKFLVTNDSLHILFGPTAEGNTNKNNRRTRLKSETKKWRTKGAGLLSTREAFEQLDGAEQ